MVGKYKYGVFVMMCIVYEWIGFEEFLVEKGVCECWCGIVGCLVCVVDLVG